MSQRPELATQDRVSVSADSARFTMDQARGLIRPGWPCADLPEDPPSVADRQSDPSIDDLYPQIAGVLTPRGPAWGTDEAGDGAQAQPVMRKLWRALCAWVAEMNRADFEVATQAFPSAITLSLPDWEAELGLPDPCFRGAAGAEARIGAVRARFGAQGGQSPAYFICLAAALGYSITIEEPDQFLIDVSAVGPDPLAETWFRIDDGEVAPDSLIEGAFQVDDGELAPDSLVDGVPAPEGAGTALESVTRAPEGDGTRLEAFALTGLEEDTDAVSDETAWAHWIVHVAALGANAGETWFRIDEGELARDSVVAGQLQPEAPGDPLEGFLTADDLECLLRRHAPQHTALTFAYAA